MADCFVINNNIVPDGTTNIKSLTGLGLLVFRQVVLNVVPPL
jgi:hypothetical protein